jgi:hypothetical protein
MTYVLAEQRDRDVNAAFIAYRKYLEANQSRFPTSAFAIASSEWYFDFRERRCPHDSPAVPAACGNGHPLSAENLRIDDGEARWRCRQCGRERAAVFRGRRKTAA